MQRDRYELGLLYERGLGVTQDREKAMELYFAAAAYSEKARSRLFSLYEANLDLPSDPHQVIAWYETAAAAGNRIALVGLGIHYQLGAGVTPDSDVACALYLQVQRSPTDQQDFASYVVSMKNPYCGADVLNLAKEMSKPGNLLNAIREYLARPRQDFSE